MTLDDAIAVCEEHGKLVVTPRDNDKRLWTHCIRGHAFDEANTYRAKNGTRRCRKCRAEKMAAARQLIAPPKYGRPLEQRLLANRNISESGCWEWLGRLNRGGYGQIKHNAKLVSVHRASYVLWIGTIPSGLCVCHVCDNRRCFNPAHLFVGTQAENIQDRDRKGRGNSAGNLPRGAAHRCAKLSEEAVRFILSSDMTNAELARRFGVNRNAIRYQKIKAGGRG